ncbi:vWA domain-containing protein [Cyclobacterium marinum]|uniref:von Willebrand factor type A n=1 Tax=Cyclobacterium marinum (strain ATCC 25205 / DSM 745 / LMG 13164 / NCIMB 1802) TaxID=880070 RepID=G0J4P0_CYCMS|nr:VWA domain-containing protein [Cyclobacterium marinum]AEL24705.1 von Willebrand factor type A [Cyclobacterium marinum DSM 745]MBI0401817.1 VWA domain-containing protein [Cyclobacterium marinum]MBR9773539.1 VWA domain-containing protein [Cytophagales bacterium]|tara:strand:+ start:54677 stop:55717 length:1041 start_codon:yes stop_codon:yes gene_type:complete
MTDVSSFFSWSWFSPETLRSFEWENFFLLHLIWIIPILLLIRKFIKLIKKPALELSLPKIVPAKNPWTYLRLLPTFFFLLALWMVVIALARPQRTNEKVEQYTEGIDIMLVMDISESMDLQDFTPNRLEAAKETAIDFINGRIADRIGMVIFSGEAFSLAPLTTDYELLTDLVNSITFNMMDAKGTAIGSAVSTGINRMRESEAKSKVMVLLSDGDNNAGNVDPVFAAQLAEAMDIKIYTIAVGKDGMVPYGTDFFGRPQMIESYLNEETLRNIARITKAEFFRASDDKALENIFTKIDELEKAEIIESRYKETMDYYRPYLIWGIIFFFIWLTLKNTFFNNFLLD